MYWSLFNASYQESVPPLYNQSFLFFPFLRFVSLLLSSVNWVMEFLAQSFSSASQHFGTKHFGQWHFRTEISSPGHFGTCTFRPCRCSGIWKFCPHGCVQGLFGMGTFRHKDFLATWTFRHRDISAHGHFGTVAQVPKCLCRNVHIALQGAKISMCLNVQLPKHPVLKHPWCQNVPMQKSPCVEKSMETKCPCAGKSAGPKHAHAKMPQWWNVHAEMSLAEMSGAKMVGSH